MAGVTALIPTLGRESLANAVDSLNNQTITPILHIDKSQRDTLIKIKEGVDSSDAEFVAICDDDGIYPPNWLKDLSAAMDEKMIAYAGGSVVPLIDEHSNDSERYIAIVTSSFFGTTSMSYRQKAPKKTKNASETNIVGVGLYRREILKKILDEEYDKIPPASWETYIFTRMRQMGYKTLIVQGAFFYHKQRDSLWSFAKQIFRCGSGRMAFLKQFRGEIIPKFFTLIPLFFVLSLFTLFIPLLAIQLLGVISFMCYFFFLAAVFMIFRFKDRELSPAIVIYLATMHISYGLGELYGLVRANRTWS